MRAPSWWEAVLLVLAAYRVCRLVGWDDLPPILAARRYITGAVWAPDVYSGASNAGAGVYNEPPAGRWVYTRPVLAHFLGCAFCQGFWVTLAWWGAWVEWPGWALVAATPWALAGAVGLVAKNLDP